MRIIRIAFSSLKTAHGELEPTPTGGLDFTRKYLMDFRYNLVVPEIQERI